MRDRVRVDQATSATTPNSEAGVPAGIADPAARAARVPLPSGPRARLQSATLTPSETRIARVILADYPASGLSTAAKLASIAEASPATATRLVAKLGYASFFEFQKVVRDDLRRHLSSPSTRIRVASGARGAVTIGWLEEAIRTDIANLERTATLVDPRAFSSLVSALARTDRHVFVVGSKKAAPVASYLATQLGHVRPGCQLLTLSETLPDQLQDARPADLLVVIEPRRATVAVANLVEFCAAQSLTVAVICDEFPAPILAKAPVVITVAATGLGTFDSYTALMTVVNAVVAAVISRLARRSRARIDRLESINSRFGMWAAPSDLRPL